MNRHKVDNAIILVSKRQEEVVPLTLEKDKEYLEVRGESLLERQVRQLNEAGISDITIAVDRIRKELDYLKKKYGVKVSHKLKYASESNFLNLYYCKEILANTYILLSDNYMVDNIFNQYEGTSWIAASCNGQREYKYGLDFDDNGRILNIRRDSSLKWGMYGPIFLTEKDSRTYVELMENYYKNKNIKNYNMEDVFVNNMDKFNIFINKQEKEKVFALDNIEEFRVLDEDYKEDSRNWIMKYISNIFEIKEYEIENVKPMEIGMTNSSFTFEVNGEKYICRVPGEGTDELVNRIEEYDVYRAIKDLRISDEIIAFDRETGIKITKFFGDSRSIKVENPLEMAKALDIIKLLHKSGARVGHRFDIQGKIRHYISLCSDTIYDSEMFSHIKFKIRELMSLEREFKAEEVLIHGDTSKNNYLINSRGEVILIDWEYSGMAPPILDIALFCIYGDLLDTEIYKVTQYYLGKDPTEDDLLQVYTYMGLSSFLWAIWTEYKAEFGEDYFDYKLRMYTHANRSYTVVKNIQQNGISSWSFPDISR